MQDVPTIFDRYQEIRPRLPDFQSQVVTKDISDLTDIAEDAFAFVFDAFGVLNVGETLIEGADRRVDELRAMGCKIRILTNAASYGRAGAIEKFRNLGINVEDDEIITSRDAALAHLTPRLWGCIAAPNDNLHDVGFDIVRLGNTAADYDRVEGFLFLSAADWDGPR